MIKKIYLSLLLTVFSTVALATPLTSVLDSKEYSFSEVANTITPGTIVILGESHATTGSANFDQLNQVNFIKSLVDQFDNVHVGMEFVKYTEQDSLDQYLRGELNDDEFKTAIGWGGSPYEEYKQQILLPLQTMGWAHALNAPRTLTSAIAKKGLDNLTPDEELLMPPQFELGSKIYEKRFYEIMGVVHDDAAPDFVKNMFAAQCTWDDTMAWKALEKFETNPQQIMVIIVGNFHARYGGGLADRLRARGHNKIITIVQVESEALSDVEKQNLIKPHADYGLIADYLW